tara:strand:+ start:523 stop:681 length:159 start_codon:yes stop_codon:yes gene_type:complete
MVTRFQKVQKIDFCLQLELHFALIMQMLRLNLNEFSTPASHFASKHLIQSLQ